MNEAMGNIRPASSEGKISLTSFKAALRDKIIRDRRFKGSPARVMYIFLDRMTLDETVKYYKRTGTIRIWGDQAVLAEECGVSRRTVCSAFQKAKKYRYLKLVKHGNQYGSISNVFEVRLDEQAEHVEILRHLGTNFS